MLRATYPLLALVLAVSTLTTSVSAAPTGEPATLAEAMEQAARLSQITLPGSPPFHLKATVAEIGNPGSDYKGEIEEYWAAPDRWRRTIKTREFSQTLVVNGDKALERNSGDYSPWWVNSVVTALFDLAPDEVKKSTAKLVSTDELRDLLKQAENQIPEMRDLQVSSNTMSCTELEEVGKGGAPDAQGIHFSEACIEQESHLLKEVTSPGYTVEFDDFRKFNNKQVARLVRVILGPGTMLEARITLLEEPGQADDSFFAVSQPTPARDRLRRVRVSEEAARAAWITPPAIVWDPVPDCQTKGNFRIVVFIDKEGKVRETQPLDSSNLFPQSQARREAMGWRFRPFKVSGAPAQAEAILSFSYETTTCASIPMLSDAEARKLAITTPRPEFADGDELAKDASFAVTAIINEEGKYIGLKDAGNRLSSIQAAANLALLKWRFRPYLNRGKPSPFYANLIFHVE